ncbi:hypothetical protein ACHAXH_000988 [Discostella pseudostelligera]
MSRIPKRTRSSLADSSASVPVDDECTGTDEPGTNTTRWQCMFTTFLAEVSAALASPYFYLLQSNGWKSLCLLTGLSEEVYSALLLECQLVCIKPGAARTVCVREDAWKDFIVQNNLRGNHDGRGSCVEITDGKITKSAVESTMMGGGVLIYNRVLRLCMFYE